VDEMRLNDALTTMNAELSYLSTARAGAVILSTKVASQALGTLQPLLDKEAGL